MNLHNNRVLRALLCFSPICMFSMENNTIKKIKDGELVREINLSRWQENDFKYLHNVDLNSVPQNDDSITEDESETTVTVTSPQKPTKKHLIHGVPAEMYFDWFNKNIQPTISCHKQDTENIVSIAKKRKISIEKSFQTFDNTFLLPLQQKNFLDILNLSKEFNMSIEQATNFFFAYNKR